MPRFYKLAAPLAQVGTRASTAAPDFGETEQDSFLGSALSTLGSGLGYVGETLTKPSRALWGTASGLTGGDFGGGLLNLVPFSDTLGLTDPSRSIELSGFLEHAGVLPENQPGFDRWDIPRFGADVLGDPLSYGTGFGTAKALGKGGQALQRAGVLDELSRASGKGPREFLSSTGFRDSLKGLSRDQLRSARDASRQMGFRGLSDLAQQAPGPLGGQLGLNLPFGQPRATIGSPVVGRAIDKALGGVASSPVGREVQRLFNPAVRGGRTQFEQAFGRDTFRGRDVMERGVDKLTLRLWDDLGRIDPVYQTPEGFTELRGVFEALEESGVPFKTDIEHLAGDAHEVLRVFHQRANEAGKDIGDLVDAYSRYFPRGKHGPIFDAHEIARLGHLRDVPGGTEQLRTIFQDTDLHELIDSGAATKQIAEFLRGRYGTEITADSPLFVEKVADDLLDERMSEWLTNRAALKSQREWDAPVREFRSKHAALARRALKDVDPDTIHPRFDEIVDEFRETTGRTMATEDDVMEALRGTGRQSAGPKPTRASIMEEAQLRAEELRAQNTLFAPEEAAEELLSSEFVRLSSKGEPVLDAVGNPTIGDRFQELAKTAKGMTEEQRQVGLFRDNPVDDFYRYMSSVGRGIVIGESLKTALAHPTFLRDAQAVGGEAAVPLGRVLRNPKSPERALGLNPQTIARSVLERAGQKTTKQDLRALLRTPIKKTVAERLVKMSRFGTAPKDRNLIHSLHLWAHNLFKGSVTSPWLAFHTRNFSGSQVQNMLVGILRPSRALAENRNAYALMNGGTLADAHAIPVVKNMLRQRGLEQTPENGTQMLRELAAAERVWDSTSATGWGTDVIGTAEGSQAPPLARLLGRIPGRTPLFGESSPLRELPRRYLGIGEDVTLNPLKAQMRGGWTGAEQSTFGPFAAGELAGSWIEGQNRLPAFIDQLRRGIDPTVAAKRVADAQVDYSSRTFTETEQALKQVVPFYSFSSKMARYVASELASRPGGPMAQAIKQTARAGQEDIHGETAIPIGELPSGSNRYLTGLGLMHEQPLGMLGTRGGNLSLAETGAQLLSSTTPLIKGPLEAVSGQSFFQRGPLGGRELTSMDPLMGGIRENIGNLLGAERRYPAPPLGGRKLEQFVANTPLSRLLSTTRTATDKRKYEDVRFPTGTALAAQLGTGLRFTDVSPQQRLREIENQIMATIREEGGYSGRFVTFTKRDIEATEKSDPDRAERMKQLNAQLSQIRRQRAELQQQ